MRKVTTLFGGMVLLVLGAQGGIRLVFNHANAGLLSRLPGGFGGQLLCYVLIAVLGAALANWGRHGFDQSEAG